MSQITSSPLSQFTSQSILPSFDLFESVRAFNNYNISLQNIWENANLPGFALKSGLKVDSFEVMSELRNMISITDLRAAGSFFTGDLLADEAVSKFHQSISPDSRILDPTCGAGNLLIACSKKLPVKSSLKETIRLWGGILIG